jgi:hypothetical protein
VLAERPALTPTPYRIGIIQGLPPPLNDETQPLDDCRGLPLGMIEFHAQWLFDAQYQAFASYRHAKATAAAPVDLALFMFSATAETFATIEEYRPDIIVTNEPRLFRRWLER